MRRSCSPFSDPLFANIEREAPAVLESLLQERLYDDGLDEARLGLHQRVDPGLSLTETTLIASLVSAYLRPTMIESAALTELARESRCAVGRRSAAHGGRR